VTTSSSEQPAETAGQPEIEFVILAERVEVLNGKLYMMGGGYDCLFLDQLPQALPITFAVGLLVPLEASGRQHQLHFAVTDGAGNAIAASEQIVLTINRPPGLPDDMSQRLVLAPLGGPVSFPSYGKFLLRVTLNDVVHRTVTLSVVGRESGLSG
jgi:hypothetical protein